VVNSGTDAPVTVPPRGPRCARCGCTWVEHEKHISEDFHRVAGRCLSCDCEEFTATANPREVEPERREAR
jgi:hypothetical protein